MQIRRYRKNSGSTAGGGPDPPGSSTPCRKLSWWLILFLCLHLSTSGTALSQAPEREVDIRFVNGDGREALIEPTGGWPLTLSLEANESKLLGVSWPFAGSGQRGFLVFEDPDGCLSWLTGCKDRPQDETWVEFTPGLLPAPAGCTGKPIGPCGESTLDSCGYGPNPLLPGLVLIADAGPGVITDEHFERLSPHKVRNLAGFFHSVAYELKDSRSRTSILAHMNVPRDLLQPVVMIDEAVDDRCEEKDILARVDGGPEVCLSDLEQVVTLRAFIVNGRAPAELADQNGDGVVDSRDAEKAGAKLISGQAVLGVRQLPQMPDLCNDPDGGLQIAAACRLFALPPEPGAITDPPR